MASAQSRSRLLALFAAVLLLLTAFPFLAPRGAEAASSTIVISQLYGGGGNAGATYTHDFVELFNLGTTTVDLTGWKIEYASANGSYNSGTTPTTLSGAIEPGQYYLVQEAKGSGGTVGLPTPDATGSITMSATAGKVRLVDPGHHVIDMVGYGSANDAETSPTPPLNNTTAAIRLDGGCRETDNNADDFTTGAPIPRNSSSPLHACGAPPADSAPGVIATSPPAGAAEVAVDTDLSITFSEPVDLAEGAITIVCTHSGRHAVTGLPAAGATTVTLDPEVDFDQAEQCTVTVEASQVTDSDADDPPDAMTESYPFSFATVAPTPPTPIHAVQGASHTSPMAGQHVKKVQGVVTHLLRNRDGVFGFYLQDPVGDDNPETAEALFVRTASWSGSAAPVAVGDAVSVNGTVVEFLPGNDDGNLTVTFLDTRGQGGSVSVLSSGHPLPAPVVLGAGGRPVPSGAIDDDAFALFDPENDAIDFWESLESMIVQVSDGQVVSGLDFGELVLLIDNGAGSGERTTRGGLYITPTDQNPERVMVDADFAPFATPLADVGDLLPGAMTGIVDYTFGNYKIQLLAEAAWTDRPLEKEVAPAAGEHQLSVATFNVENLAATSPAGKFNDLADLVVNHLQSPDIVAVAEMQDNNGTADGGVVAADQTYARLIDAIAAAGGPTYQYRQIDPERLTDGGAPVGNIRVGFLFRTDQGLTFIDRPGADATTANTVVAGGAGPELRYSPGRIDPANSAFHDSRKPLAAEFLYNNQKLFVIANHFNSKGGDDGLFGSAQPPVLHTEAQRIAQATVVADFVGEILAKDPGANVIVLGDLNDFPFSAPLAILEEAGLHNLMKDLPPEEQYTYVFNGNSQALDHILVSDNLYEGAAPLYDIVHVNAEFAFNNRASDHDPQVVLLTLPPVTGRSAYGGGSFTFPAGAYTPDPSLSGKASTGFSIRLGEELKGQLQLSIHGVLDFHAAEFDWAAFSATGVEFEGRGTAKGLGAFRFRADAATGDKRAKDSFRIILWDEATGEVLFDSGTQTLSGSIQIR